MRTLTLAALTLMLTIAVAACGADAETPATGTDTTPAPQDAASPTPPAAGPAGDTESVEITDFMLPSLTVSPGTTISWTNQDGVPHTATAGRPGAESGEWDSGNLQRGQSYSFTFTEPGEFSYFCRVHPNMTGTITVGTSGSTGQAASPSPTAPQSSSDGNDEDEYYY